MAYASARVHWLRCEMQRRSAQTRQASYPGLVMPNDDIKARKYHRDHVVNQVRLPWAHR